MTGRSAVPIQRILDGEVWGEVGKQSLAGRENSGRGETGSPENVPVH
jgi:hypothetical protein